MPRHLFVSGLTAFVILVHPLPAGAQVTTGTLVGTVRDAGGVVPGM